MAHFSKHTFLLPILLWGTARLDAAPIDEAARQTVNVVSLQNNTPFLVVVQQTESPRYVDGSFRPKRTVKTFVPGRYTSPYSTDLTVPNPVVDFKDTNLFNTPFPLFPASRLDFFPGADPKRFPIPREEEDTAALVITVFTKGWQPDGNGVCTFTLTVKNNRLRVTEIEKQTKNGKMVKAFYSSFLKDSENFVYFDGDTRRPLIKGDEKKEQDSTMIPTGFAADLAIVAERLDGKWLPLLRMAIKPEVQFMRAPAHPTLKIR